MPSRNKSKSKELPTEPKETEEPSSSTPAARSGETKTIEETGYWELMNETRGRLEVGKPEPKRLAFTLKHSKTGEKKTFKVRIPDEGFDWDNPKYIHNANKYRDNVCTRYGLPSKVKKDAWTPNENAWLEIMFAQKLKGPIPKDYTSRPHLEKIREAVSSFFVGRTDLSDNQGRPAPARGARDKSSFVSYVNRPTGAVRALQDAVNDQLKDNSAGAWIPDITDAEIDAHLGSKTPAAGVTTADIVTPAHKGKTADKLNATTKSRALTLSDTEKSKPDGNPEASAGDTRTWRARSSPMAWTS
jgi:hypothetical protein